MELRHLRYFVAVAETLNFTRAAQALHIGQPPLSQQIQALEAELGVQLFERSKRHVALTDAGRQFQVRAVRLLADAGEAVDEVRRAGRGELGVLRIGFTSSLPLTARFPSMLSAHRERYPRVRLELREMFTPDQFAALRNRELDVGFVRFNAEFALEGVRLIELQRDPLRMVIPAGHPLAGADEVSLAQFRDDHFILYPQHAGAGLANLTRKLCQAAGFEPEVWQEAGEATTQIGLVSAGLGVTVMPATLECVQVPGVRYVPLRDAGAYHTMSLALREGVLPPLAARFVEQLEPSAPVGA